VALVRERTISTERPPLVGEVSANFCGWKGVAWSVRRMDRHLKDYSALYPRSPRNLKKLTRVLETGKLLGNLGSDPNRIQDFRTELHFFSPQIPPLAHSVTVDQSISLPPISLRSLQLPCFGPLLTRHSASPACPIPSHAHSASVSLVDTAMLTRHSASPACPIPLHAHSASVSLVDTASSLYLVTNTKTNVFRCTDPRLFLDIL
jgi:hypothetical protein